MRKIKEDEAQRKISFVIWMLVHACLQRSR